MSDEKTSKGDKAWEPSCGLSSPPSSPSTTGTLPGGAGTERTQTDAQDSAEAWIEGYTCASSGFDAEDLEEAFLAGWKAKVSPTAVRGPGCPACSGTGFGEAPAATQDAKALAEYIGDTFFEWSCPEDEADQKSRLAAILANWASRTTRPETQLTEKGRKE